MLCRYILFYSIVFILSACSGTPASNSQFLHRPSLDSRLLPNANIQSMLEDKAISDGDTITVRMSADDFYEGKYDRRESSSAFLMLLQKSSPGNLSYMRLPVSNIKAIYQAGEAIVVKNDIQVKKGKRDIFRLIEEGISNNDTGKIENVLENGWELGAYPGVKFTPLHSAARTHNRPEVIRYLIAKGADVNALNGNSLTPLMVSIQVNHFENARAMVESGADLYFRSPEHDITPVSMLFSQLRWASESDEIAIQDFIDFLVNEEGMDINRRFDAQPYKANNSLGMSALRLIELSRDECFSILDKKNIRYKRLPAMDDVSFPVRLLSPVSGIKYRHTGGSKNFSIMDCRLVVALIGMGDALKKYQVREIQHMRSYSPGATIGGSGKVSGHHHALALDISQITTRKGKKYNVYRDWKDRRHRAEPCEPYKTDDKNQSMLRNMICDIAKQDLFHWILTPHYNKSHHDHFHVEIRDGMESLIFN